jgi:hypothetical protein
MQLGRKNFVWVVAIAVSALVFVSVEDAVADTMVCTVIPQYPPYVFPAPNWGPFFRHHYYRYGPTPTCVLTAAPVTAVPGPIISVRY